MTRLAVCINWPYEMIAWDLWATLWASDVRQEKEVVILRPVSPNPALSGNMVAKIALEQKVDEILFLDADQTVPRNILERFRSHNKDIVAALTPLRPYPHQWSMFNFHPQEPGKRVNIKPQPGGIQKVEVTGCGCMLVKMDVFRKIEPPWFDNIYSPDGCALLTSADFYFFDKCKKAGIELWIDTDVESGHTISFTLNSQTLGRNIHRVENIPDEQSVPV